MQDEIIAALQKESGKAGSAKRFFKTGKGDYAEKDKFLDISSPSQRKVAKAFCHAPFFAIEILLASEWHEHRHTGLLILVYQYKGADTAQQEKIVCFYLTHLKGVNNWDLVDVSAPYILGPWFLHRNRKTIHELFASGDLWKRRIAILTNWYFIRQSDFNDLLFYLPELIQDSRDLIQKAAGWMLREMGKRDQTRLIQVLDTYTSRMPRTMLRYAIEKLPKETRRHYLTK